MSIGDCSVQSKSRPAPNRRQPAPISTERVRDAADGVGRRLVSEFSALLALVPNAPSRRALAQAMGVDRNALDRLDAAIAPGNTGADAISSIPGTEALESIIDGVIRAGVPERQTRAAMSAVGELRQLIKAGGGSVAALRRTLGTHDTPSETGPGATGFEPGKAARRKAALAIAQAIGSHAALRVYMHAIRPSENFSPGATRWRVQQAGMNAQLGLTVEPGAMPVVLSQVLVRDGAKVAIENQPGDGHGAHTSHPARDEHDATKAAEMMVVPSFTTPGAPLCVETVRDGLSMLVMDRTIGQRVGPIDLAHFNQLPEGDLRRTHSHAIAPVHAVYAFMRVPVRRLVVDVFLHHELARHSTTHPVMFLVRPGIDPVDSAGWLDRLPGRGELLHATPGDVRVGLASFPPLRSSKALPGWDAYPQATQYLFNRAGWDPREFVLHRLDFEYPLWGATYGVHISFPSMAGGSPLDPAFPRSDHALL